MTPFAPLSAETVIRMLRLSRLEVDAAELPRLTEDLANILGYVRILESVDTEGVVATAHLLLERLPLRADEVGESLSRDEILAEAPRHAGEGFSVPTFVDG